MRRRRSEGDPLEYARLIRTLMRRCNDRGLRAHARAELTRIVQASIVFWDQRTEADLWKTAARLQEQLTSGPQRQALPPANGLLYGSDLTVSKGLIRC